MVYILSRTIGKLLGAGVTAKLTNCSSNIVKYLGITLLPQAGVALGMAITVSSIDGIGSLIKNVILFSVLVYELVGPLLTKIALTKAGEIDKEGKTSERATPPVA